MNPEARKEFMNPKNTKRTSMNPDSNVKKVVYGEDNAFLCKLEKIFCGERRGRKQVVL